MSFGFSYGGKHSSEFGILITNIERPVLPNIQSKTVSLPTKHGIHYVGSQFDFLEINFEILLSEHSMKRLQETRRNIAAWLNPAKGALQLIIDDETDKYYVAVLSGESSLEQILTHGRGEISFLIPDPYAYAVLDDVYSYTQKGEYTFIRKGTAESYPFISVKGNSSEQGTLNLHLNSSEIKYKGELLQTQELIIDYGLKTAYIKENGVTIKSAINQLVNLDFPFSIPGNNSFKITTTENFKLNGLSIYCKSRWI
ncbi:distal tail protein Dit [Cytobacillus purgationiresistens]|uniref:Phage tail component-like protein n=1 Tax=Cytobacillus purgationiresistens TaxID=863449 RepID=A0ABU0AQ81_9BACI|nr:distal tail protein Dit [Cytobacillus purgationiresistens]MDQ0273004.1 putative phage tail component-like protein [Cytobacillus purgationiresistens]